MYAVAWPGWFRERGCGGNKQPGFPFLQRTTLRRDVVLLIPTSDIEIWIGNLRIVVTESKSLK
jgi:hypothetical protein